MAKAAVLAFAAPSKRPENSIVYHSDNWDELIDLLECPTEFLRMKGKENCEISWCLLARSTIAIEPMGETDLDAIRCAYLLGWEGPEAPPPVSFLVEAQKAREFLTTGAGARSGGQFFVEWATYTHTLKIKYQLPTNAASRLPKFSSLFDEITHVPIAGLPGLLKVGNIHFDIKGALGKSERYRAEFVLDFLEDRTRLLPKLGLSPFFNNPAAMANVGHGVPPIPISVLPVGTMPITPPPTIGFEPTLPTVILEGGSVPDLPDGCCVCIDGDTRIVNSTVIINGVLIKCYSCS
jgi:hypothetical protein